ncbi:TraR/DksA C4-type zinc finger protein [Ferribacterium limneticum]|uniref:hypothetical protein n=1 Tax=Ferribacterium limneticum TaxID=76259 RepID=UPI001CF82B76|nr:hypothetical protein [Ferribacterium limneticum]UCV26714.1 hypothetical protein KI617_10375 [Ferribacterium limneticum]UCV30631.1 hypothetical protein KI608_10375 [Ferribacterium limneticum]
MILEDNEQLPDPIDQGSALAERERASLLAAQRRKAAPDQVKVQLIDYNGDPQFTPEGQPIMVWPTEECVECGEPIGAGRLELGYNTCIDCATTAEKVGKGYARK